MAKQHWWQKILNPTQPKSVTSMLRQIAAGSFYKVSDIKSNTSLSDIRTKIETMRALANDSQVATALSYYATDATTTNSSGQIIWATAVENGPKDAPKIINALFNRWNINMYARDHILELSTIGNLYMPTTELYRETGQKFTQIGVSLDQNTIPDDEYDIVPSTKIPPEDIVHLWFQGKPSGYVIEPEEQTCGGSTIMTTQIVCPESSVIHFSLGGLIGDYTIDAATKNGDQITYDIQFAEPLMSSAVQPTQILNLLEDANVLSSLVKVVRFVNVDCGDAEEEEIRDTLQQIKDTIEQQLSLNTQNGDTQSFLNPQSPNNLVYIPKINGNDAISITDLNMTDTNENEDKILQYYQDKKLSAIGVPKEALNFSSSEGLGNAGAVMSQRSALYANSLQRIETAYINGWRSALNTYFRQRNLSGYVDKFTLHMNPIVTAMDSIKFEQRDSALSQATTIVELLKSVSVKDAKPYITGIVEALQIAFPELAASICDAKIDVSEPAEGGE